MSTPITPARAVADTAAPRGAAAADTVDNAVATPEREQPYGALGLKDDEYAQIREILGRAKQEALDAFDASDARTQLSFLPLHLRRPLRHS